MYFRMIKRTNQHKFKSVVMATTTNCYFQTSTTNVGWNHRQRVKCDFMPGTKSICLLRVIGKLWVYFVGFNTGFFLIFFYFPWVKCVRLFSCRHVKLSKVKSRLNATLVNGLLLKIIASSNWNHVRVVFNIDSQ